jgi:hypothetical protein
MVIGVVARIGIIGAVVASVVVVAVVRSVLVMVRMPVLVSAVVIAATMAMVGFGLSGGQPVGADEQRCEEGKDTRGFA